MLLQILIGLVIGIGSFGLVMFILKWTSPNPKGLGIANGKLNPCENSPNCICSEDSRVAFSTERIPFPSTNDPETITKKLTTLPRTKIIKFLRGPSKDPVLGEIPSGGFYIHAESHSLLIGFIDDIQIYWAPGDNGLQIRSSSRAGYSDLGVNKGRISQIRELLNQTNEPRNFN